MSIFTKKPATTLTNEIVTPVFESPTHCIARGMTVYGNMSFEGQLDLSGTVNGAISGEADSNVLVQIDGLMEGPIQASTVIVEGTVEGDISADFVEVKATGSVNGSIVARVFHSEPGASLSGSISVIKMAETVETETEAAEAA